jgi:hypothetical protein
MALHGHSISYGFNKRLEEGSYLLFSTDHEIDSSLLLLAMTGSLIFIMIKRFDLLGFVPQPNLLYSLSTGERGEGEGDLGRVNL